jgi:hypothetical protein
LQALVTVIVSTVMDVVIIVIISEILVTNLIGQTEAWPLDN